MRRIQDRYASDKDVAHRSTKEKFAFIVSNMDLLEKVDRNGNHENFLDDVTDDIEGDIPLKEWQTARIEKIYELIFKGAGFDFVNDHKDRRRKGLRFGK